MLPRLARIGAHNERKRLRKALETTMDDDYAETLEFVKRMEKRRKIVHTKHLGLGVYCETTLLDHEERCDT